MSTEKYTGSITLASIKDGADGILYDIQTNHEKIYKFFSSSDSAVFSPESISFKAYKTENEKSGLIHPNSDYDTDIALAGYSDNKNFSHLWYFLNKLTGQNNQQKKNLLEVVRNIENDTVSFNFYSLFDYFVSEELDENNKAEDVAAFKEFINLLKTENGCFIYKIFKHSYYEEWPAETNLLAIKPIQFEFGTSEDMAKFAITATSINAAVGKSTLEFDADGLTIRNGHFEIIDNNGNPLLQYTPPLKEEDNGLLKIIGNGEFSGTIHATDGEFTGKIHATDGEFTGTINATEGDIGEFIIKNDGLYSKGGAKKTLSGYDTTNSNIKLLGKEGRIEAENIYLGIGAQINKYIQLGKAKLWNPEHKDANNKLLEAGGINLSQTGELTLNGPDSKILGQSFSITPKMATFQNVNVYGKISTVVFEQNHVQSVGGSMIFKPSYKVEDYKSDTNGDILTLDKKFLGKVDETNEKGEKINRNYVYLVNTDGSLVEGQISITEKNDENKTVVISSNLNLSSDNGSNPLVSLIDIGTEGSLIIGVNSNDGGTGFLRPRGLTITEYNVESNISSAQNPKVFLGDLDASGIVFTDNKSTKGFGLYSENVYLIGSLTTKINTDSNINSQQTYAGINTLNSATASKFNPDLGVAADNSRIVFWAGANDTSSIVGAPFQVTERGSLYAAQGLFEGAIISKSVIRGTDIYAARIHGEGNSPNGLSFYDTNTGIVFYNGDPYARPYTKMEDFTEGKFKDNKTLYYIYDDTKKEYRQCTDEDVYNSKISYYIKTVEKEVFSIGNDGLKYGNDSSEDTENNYFIEIKNGKTKFIGDEIQTSDYFTNKTGTSFLHLKDNRILGSHIVDNTSEKIHANISFNEEELSLGLNTQGDFVINSNEIQLKKGTVKMNKTVLFGEQLKYEQTDNGYNLYVL